MAQLLFTCLLQEEGKAQASIYFETRGSSTENTV